MEGSGVGRVGDESRLVDVYADAHNRGAYLGVDEGVLNEYAGYFAGANVNVVGPFDGNRTVGQEFFHKIKHRQRGENVEQELVLSLYERWVKNDAEADVFARL